MDMGRIILFPQREGELFHLSHFESNAIEVSISRTFLPACSNMQEPFLWDTDGKGLTEGCHRSS